MPGRGYETLSQLLIAFPEMHSVMKAYSPGFVQVPLTTITTPRDSSGRRYRTDCKVRGIFVVVEREAHVRRSRCVIKQDYLVQWLDGRRPGLTYYTGTNARLTKISRSLKQIEIRHISKFCAEFGTNGQYGCGKLPGHWYERADSGLPHERYWRLAFQFALAWARERERTRAGGPRRKTNCPPQVQMRRRSRASIAPSPPTR